MSQFFTNPELWDMIIRPPAGMDFYSAAEKILAANVGRSRPVTGILFNGQVIDIEYTRSPEGDSRRNRPTSQSQHRSPYANYSTR